MNEYIRHALLIGSGVLAIMVLDGLYLGVIAKSWYRKRLEGVGRFSLSEMTPSSIIAGLAAWTIIVGGLYWFVLLKHNFIINRSLIMESFLYGSLAYGIYNLTNHSFLKQWPLSLALADIAWGTCINGLIGYLIAILHKHI